MRTIVRRGLRFIAGITVLSVSLACAATAELTPTAPPNPTTEIRPTEQATITPPPTATDTPPPAPTITPSPTLAVPTLSAPLPISGENLADLQTTRELHMDGTEFQVGDVVFSHGDAMLAAISNSGEIKVWEISTGDVLLAGTASDSDYGMGYPGVAFSSDGNSLASTGVAWNDENGEFWGAAYLWDLETPDEAARFFNVTHRSVMDVAFSPDGLTLVAGTQDGMGGGGHVLVWSVATGELINDPLLADWITAVTVSPDGRRIAATTYGAVITLEPTTGETLMVMDLVEGALWDVAYLPNRLAMVVRGDSSVALIDPVSSRYPPIVAGDSGDIADMAVFFDGSLLATASGEDDAVTFWEMTEGREIFQLRGQNAPALSVAFSSDGYAMASLHADGTVLLWGALEE